MTKSEFLNNINQNEKELIEKLIPVIEKYEEELEQVIIFSMGTNMYAFKQNGEFKYAFAVRENHFSFYNMVMYCYPEINNKYKTVFKDMKFLKSCINFNNTEQFPFSEFEALIKESSSYKFPK